MQHPHHIHTHAHTQAGSQTGAGLRLVAWETTRRCNLACKHCRAVAEDHPYDNEIGTESSLKLLEQIREVGTPIIILTGGEPLLRSDIFEIAAYGSKLGLRMVMAPNGTLITPETAIKMKESGIKRISVSIDGAGAEFHDRFRGVPNAFERAIQGIKTARDAGIEFQINTTITKANLEQIPDILKFAEDMGAVAHHIFLLVPTGRGKYILDSAIDSDQYEKTLNWFYEQREKVKLQLKATCAPHYYRIMRQRSHAEGKRISFETHGLDAVTRGCLAGTGFCFISHVGRVQTCGFLDVTCGDVTKQHFREIWEKSPVFNRLRDFDKLEGKCGICQYKKVCGGCRARAYEATGNYLAEEPLCSYQPCNTGG